MRGIAIIDRQPGSDTIAVWATTRMPVEAHNVQCSPVIDAASDPGAVEKVRSLTRCCACSSPMGTVLDGLPVEGSRCNLR